MAYRRSLELAKEYHLASISFPLISSGIYGYPKDQALQVAISVISEFLLHNDMKIYLVVFDRKAISISEKLFTDINHYIDTYYEDSDEYEGRSRQNRASHEFDQIYNVNLGVFAKQSIKKTKKLRKEPSVEKDQLEKSLFEDTSSEDTLFTHEQPLLGA